MKVFVAGMLILAVACHNNSETATQSDNSHTEHKTDTTHQQSTMKQLMENNMRQMMMVRPHNVADFDFAELMKIHHQGAIDMAKLELQQGTDPTVKKMAQQIINDQQKEIAVFDEALTIKLELDTSSVFFKQAVQDMHSMSLKNEKSFVDRAFIQMMIPHHESAIVMAKIYLQNGAHLDSLKKVANNIIKTQQAEIDQFNKLLSQMK